MRPESSFISHACNAQAWPVWFGNARPHLRHPHDMSQSPTPAPCTAGAVAALCQGLGFDSTPLVTESLAAYLNMLVKWNRIMNLVGPAHWEEILATLVLDSLHLEAFLHGLPLPEHPECWDLGAGAGLPGLPLRMLWQKGTYTLVEAREKRALFLRAVLAARPLPGTFVFQGRAETFMPMRPKANLVVSRAFLPWERVLTLVQNHLEAGALCLFLAGAPVPKALPKGWTAMAGKGYTIAQNARYLWALHKI